MTGVFSCLGNELMRINFNLTDVRYNEPTGVLMNKAVSHLKPLVCQ